MEVPKVPLNRRPRQFTAERTDWDTDAISTEVATAGQWLQQVVSKIRNLEATNTQLLTDLRRAQLEAHRQKEAFSASQNQLTRTRQELEQTRNAGQAKEDAVQQANNTITNIQVNLLAVQQTLEHQKKEYSRLAHEHQALQQAMAQLQTASEQLRIEKAISDEFQKSIQASLKNERNTAAKVADAFGALNMITAERDRLLHSQKQFQETIDQQKEKLLRYQILTAGNSEQILRQRQQLEQSRLDLAVTTEQYLKVQKRKDAEHLEFRERLQQQMANLNQQLAHGEEVRNALWQELQEAQTSKLPAPPPIRLLNKIGQ